MKKTILALLLCLPLAATASYMDVIEFELVEGCSFDTYMGIVNDFNANWGSEN